MRNFTTTAAQAYDTAPASPLAQMGLKMSFARDEEIYAQEEDADLVYQVVSGAVRTTRLLSDGRRQIGDFYYPGEFFGMEPGEQHRFSAEALCDCVILVIKKSAVQAFGGAELQHMMWQATARELRRAQDHMLLLGRKTACEKVASFLVEMADRQDAETIFLPMGRQDMADYLGLTIETVSRMLTQLQARRQVAFTSARHFRLADRQGLEMMCE